jgi:hypothetical protein
MGYTFGEMVVGEPLTPARQSFLKEALRYYGVSAAGAEQFVGNQPVTDVQDRRQLLDFVNRVVLKASGLPRGFRGKGGL